MLLIYSLSGREQIFLYRGTTQFSFPLGIYSGALCYSAVLSPAANRSFFVSLPTNSLSHWESTLESCATHQFSLLPGTDLAISRYTPILFLTGKLLWSLALATSSLPPGN